MMPLVFELITMLAIFALGFVFGRFDRDPRMTRPGSGYQPRTSPIP
jgi:hypothetical protein